MLTIKNRAGKEFISILALATLLAGCSPPGPRALLEGKRLLDRGRYPEALEKLKLATSLLNTNAQAWNYLGLAWQYAGQPTNAAQAYQKALAMNHDLVEVHYNLGCLWLDQNRLEPAKSELITFTSLRKNSTEGWLKLGTVQLHSARAESRLLKSGALPAHLPDLAAAEASYSEALRLSPGNPEALNGLGLVQLYRSHPREAAQWFGNALKQQPDYAPALLNLAIVSQQYLNQRELALQKYREYLALPLQAPDRENVISAVRELERELQASPRAPMTNMAVLPPVNTNLAKLSAPPPVRMGGPRGYEPPPNVVRTAPAVATPDQKVEVVKLPPEPVARSAQDVAPARDPSPAPPTKSAAVSPKAAEKSGSERPGFFARMNPLKLLQRDSQSGARPAAEPSDAGVSGPEPTAPAAGASPGSVAGSRAVLAPSGVGGYKYRSPAKPAAGDHSAAERAFAQGLQAQQANRLLEATQSYRRATQLDPAYYDAYYNLGLAAGSAGNLQQALVACEFALAIRPESPDARYNLALLLKQANYLSDAANELERLLSIYPGEPRGHLALGNLYAQQLRQPAKAREHYLKVLEYDPHNPQAAAIRYWLIANPP
jgi:tetratricopeptide (TPR) repeat protein